MVTVIVRKMYALILKSVWSWLKTFVDKKKTAARGARPDLPAQISAGGFPVWSSALAAADGMQHDATAGTKRATEAQRCLDLFPGRTLLTRVNTTIYLAPRALPTTIYSSVYTLGIER